FMHIEIDQRNDPAGNEDLAQYLLGVLADVRAAVTDWRPMRDRVAELVESGLDGPDAQEVTEARDFLNWLAEDHFTFLGWRSFHFAEDGSIGTITGSGLGILRDPTTRMFDEARALAVMPPEVRDFVRRPNLLLITKSNRTATVHRPVPMDIIGLKRFDGGGRVVGLEAILGLFAATAYTLSPTLIPVLRRKVERVIARTGFLPDSHDGKALLHIIESYPRDEVFQMSEDALFEAVLGILHLQERQRVALFLRHDEFDRFISCLVYVPRDRYDTRLRHAFRAILEQSFNGHLATFSTEVGNAPLARIHFIIHIDPDAIPDYRRQDIEARLAEAARSWMDRVQETLIAVHGEEHGLHLARRYAEAFPASYGETTGIRAAAFDIGRIEAVLAGSGL
ncbi:MAG: NAD-glutamate dehydrogenase, partial [Rhodospirillales bacterium]|nr:NAD-glutamate dehydrogenase [Rhodospirillales bacterium]